MKKAAKRFFDAAHSHPNPLVASAARYTPSQISRIRRPRHTLTYEDDEITLYQERLRLAKKAATTTHNRPSYRPRRRRVSSRRPMSHPPIPLLVPAHAEPALSIMPLNTQNQIQQVPSCSSPSNALSRGTNPTRGRP